MSNREIRGSVWYSSLSYSERCPYCDKQQIGIVEVYDTITEELIYYIGLGDGKDLKADEERIKQTGAKFYPEMFGKEPK